MLNGQVYSDLDAILVSRQELIRVLVRENGWTREEMSGQVLMLAYDADRLFPLEQTTTVPTASLSRFFDTGELSMLARPRRIWENEPPIRPDLHKRLLAILIHTHLIPETLAEEDIDDLNDAFDASAQAFLDVLQHMQMRHDGHPSHEVPLYRKDNRYLAVCPPFDRDAADLSLHIRSSDDIQETVDAVWDFLSAADGSDAVWDPPTDETSGDAEPGDAEPKATESRGAEAEHTQPTKNERSDTGESNEALILALQLIALLLGLGAIAYAVLSLA